MLSPYEGSVAYTEAMQKVKAKLKPAQIEKVDLEVSKLQDIIGINKDSGDDLDY